MTAFSRLRPVPDKYFRPPSLKLEAAVWLFIAALAIGLRLYVAYRLPAYIWTRDSGSYVDPAADWTETGQWITNPRRGPLYSLFIAGIFKMGGSLLTVVNIQAAMGFGTACLVVAAARKRLGRQAFWPLALCSLYYAVYTLPIELERLIRNEALLTSFAAGAFGAWRFALRDDDRLIALDPVHHNDPPPGNRAGWFLLCGLSAGLMHLLKGIFPIFPLLVLGSIGWRWRRQPMWAAALAGCFLAPFIAPTAASKLYDRLSGTGRPPEPEAGIMFYGRTAQWTYLDGGMAPEIKAMVRDQVQAYIDRYRKTGYLSNNEIVKRTVVPSLKRIFKQQSQSAYRPADLDRFCWRLGFEAVRHHPFEYARHMIGDFYTLNFYSAHRAEPFTPRQSLGAADDVEDFIRERYPAAAGPPPPDAERMFQAASNAATLRSTASQQAMKNFSRWDRFMRWLRVFSPVLLTTLLIPAVWRFSRGGERLYWLGMAALWYYYVILLATVGRPLDRYFMPMTPLIFWTISTALAMAWRRYVSRQGAPETGAPRL